MAQVTRVQVTVADLQPVAAFIAACARADAMIRSASLEERASLPGTVASGAAELEAAVATLRQATGGPG